MGILIVTDNGEKGVYGLFRERFTQATYVVMINVFFFFGIFTAILGPLSLVRKPSADVGASIQHEAHFSI